MGYGRPVDLDLAVVAFGTRVGVRAVRLCVGAGLEVRTADALGERGLKLAVVVRLDPAAAHDELGLEPGSELVVVGDEFVVARWALVALVLGQLVNVGAGSVGYLLIMTGHQIPCARVFFASAVVNVILNAIAIPRFGILGAAIATAFSMMLWNVWLHRLVVKHLNVRPSILFAFQQGSDS